MLSYNKQLNSPVTLDSHPEEDDDDPYAVELSLHETEMSEDENSSKHRTKYILLQFRIDLISKVE